jgi:dihydrofolate reductase
MTTLRSLIVAIGPNGIIGNKTSLLWHCKKDFEFFKTITMNKPCIFGDVTFFNMKNHPLKNRLNIVTSLDYNEVSVEVNEKGGYIKSPSIEKALEISSNFDEVVICGGRSIYKYCLDNDLVDRIYFSTIYSKELEDNLIALPEEELISFPVDINEYTKNWAKYEIEDSFSLTNEDNLDVKFYMCNKK